MLHKTRNSEHTTKGHHKWNVLPTILILRFVPIWTCPLILGTTLIFTFYDATSNDPLTLEHLSGRPNAMRDAWWNPPLFWPQKILSGQPSICLHLPPYPWYDPHIHILWRHNLCSLDTPIMRISSAVVSLFMIIWSGYKETDNPGGEEEGNLNAPLPFPQVPYMLLVLTFRVNASAAICCFMPILSWHQSPSFSLINYELIIIIDSVEAKIP